MHWEKMTVEEFATYRREEGMKLVKSDSIWWAEVRPCFFRPLFPFREITPGSKRYPVKSILGGILHLVPPAVPTESCINFHVYDDLKNYSLDMLNGKRRKVTRDSLSRFTIKPITDPDEFIEKGYEVYKIFFERTNYWYHNDRIDKDKFRIWAGKLYHHSKINKTGMYLSGKLCAVATSYRIEDVICGDYLFSDNEGLRANVVDFLMHILRESAACTDAKYFFSGLPTGVDSLDSSKTKKGCKLLRLPAYCKINPLALSVAKVLMKDSYRKLLKVIDPGAGDS
jgi:hypothetical protein